MASRVTWLTTTCNTCHCVNGGKPCDICVYFNFNCRGTCVCCAESRRALPSTSKDQGTSSVTKQDPEHLCTECDCLKTSIPCRKCIRGNFKCTGSCPCCVQSQERILNPNARSQFDPICPRCTRSPGEGFCDFCRKTTEESVAALARLKPRGRRRPKPAILEHKKKVGNTSTDPAVNVNQPAYSKVKELNKGNDLRLLNQSYLTEEYCLHCQCKKGTEPCITCRNSPCYGDCVCCRQFNRSFLYSEKLLEDLPDISTYKEGQMDKSATIEVRKDVCLASTSGTSVGPSSVRNLKCERCDCFKNFMPCNECSDNDMGCIFSGDAKLCLCCTIKSLVV